MIKEDYVSFELAKLLKEKSFDEDCFQIYDEEGYLSFNHVGYINSDEPNEDFCALAPTHQRVMKWLREIHNIIVIIDYNDDEECFKEHQKYGFTIYSKNLIKVGLELLPTYEEAVEMALKYVLKNLL